MTSYLEWHRCPDMPSTHYVTTRAGKYTVSYRANAEPGHKFVGKLNGKDLSNVSGPDIDVVKLMIEERIHTARKIAAIKD